MESTFEKNSKPNTEWLTKLYIKAATNVVEQLKNFIAYTMVRITAPLVIIGNLNPANVLAVVKMLDYTVSIRKPYAKNAKSKVSRVFVVEKQNSVWVVDYQKGQSVMYVQFITANPKNAVIAVNCPNTYRVMHRLVLMIPLVKNAGENISEPVLFAGAIEF